MNTVYNDIKPLSRYLSLFVWFLNNFYFCNNIKPKILSFYKTAKDENIYKC